MPYASRTQGASPGKAYFDVRDDIHSRDESDDYSNLTWRGDPQETGADTTLVVVTNELDAVTYYIHKRVICFGRKQSKYLSNLLMLASSTSNNNSHGKQRYDDENTKKMPSIKVELDQRDTENVPIFLDFVYSHCGKTGHVAANIPDNGTMETCELTISFSGSGGGNSAACKSMASSSSLHETHSNDSDDNFVESGEINTDNAVSLRHLARTFQNDALTRAVNKFIQKDLNFRTGPVYLYKAWEYKDDRLKDSAQRLCAENIEQIDKKALIRLPLHLFKVVVHSLESFEEENKELSMYLSEVVCRYLEKHPETRSVQLLLELTDPLLMPYITSEAAIGYTAIVKDFNYNETVNYWNDLVRLCRRCAEAVVREYGWSDFSVNAAVDEYLGKHKKKDCKAQETLVDSLLFATSFAAALEQAQDDHEDILEAHDRMNGIVKELTNTASLMESVQQRKDEYIQRQQIALKQATEEIVLLRKHVHELKQKLQSKQNPSPLRIPQQRQHQHRQQQQLQQQPYNPSPQRERVLQDHQPINPQTQRFYSSPQRMRPQPSVQRPSHPKPPPPRTTIATDVPVARHRQMLREQSEALSKQSLDKIECMLRNEQQSVFSQESMDVSEARYEEAIPYSRNSRELVSPTQVGGTVHEEKNRTRQELRTKSEMRSRSLLV